MILKAYGRYAFTARYVERVVTAARLRPEIQRAHLRIDSGGPVPGLVVRALI